MNTIFELIIPLQTIKIAETLPESDAMIGELLTKKMELSNKIIVQDDINKNLVIRFYNFSLFSINN